MHSRVEAITSALISCRTGRSYAVTNSTLITYDVRFPLHREVFPLTNHMKNLSCHTNHKNTHKEEAERRREGWKIHQINRSNE